ncbi:hypothetical protein [Saccharopolyspora griseoalba]|uniref:Permease n=1 Tax=Saccharopolyspora griseoalba TaxID=1431848 RepID=A0ABW2LIT9_9PSEU
MLLAVLLCAFLGRLTIRSWMLLPLLFLGSASGVAALLDHALRQPDLDGYLTLSTPLLFGFAAGLTIVSAGNVRWGQRWQRIGLRFGYPVLMIACAIGLNGLVLPRAVALAIGPLAVLLLATLLVRTHRNRDEVECLHTS